MIEIAEAKYIVDQINHHLIERTITKVEVMNTPHRFAWLNENATDYENRLCNQRIKKAKQNGSMVRILMGNDVELVFSEDVYFAYLKADLGTTKNQLALNFDNDMRLEVRTKLYGFLMIGKEAGLKISNPYFQRALDVIDPLDEAFTYAYFIKETGLDKTTGTIKSALATQQHIPGFGNGTLQDVLFASKIVPERKVSSLTIQEKQTVFHEMKKTIKAMYLAGGRDQSTDLFGKLGGYKTVMTNQKSICPICNTPMTKKAYLGGKVIYCTTCQT